MHDDYRQQREPRTIDVAKSRLGPAVFQKVLSARRDFSVRYRARNVGIQPQVCLFIEELAVPGFAGGILVGGGVHEVPNAAVGDESRIGQRAAGSRPSS